MIYEQCDKRRVSLLEKRMHPAQAAPFMNLAKYAPVSLGIDFPAAKITERFYFVVARKSKSASRYPDSSFRAARCSSNNEGLRLNIQLRSRAAAAQRL
jgi:hypothetical protein